MGTFVQIFNIIDCIELILLNIKHPFCSSPLRSSAVASQKECFIKIYKSVGINRAFLLYNLFKAILT